MLINEGADIEAEDTLSGWTPLHVACVKANFQAATALIDAGAKKNRKSSLGEIPLRCIKRDRSNTKLYNLMCTNVKQLDLWPAKWLESELRRGGRGRGNRDSNDGSGSGSEMDSNNDSEMDEFSDVINSKSSRSSRDTRDTRSTRASPNLRSSSHREDSTYDDKMFSENDDGDDYDDDDYED